MTTELQHQFADIPPDGAHARCAACGSAYAGTRMAVEGVLLMLCNNAAACASRYRAGLTPAEFARRLRAAADTQGD